MDLQDTSQYTDDFKDLWDLDKCEQILKSHCMCVCQCEGHKTTYGNQSFLSTVWVWGIELRSPGMEATTSLPEPSPMALAHPFLPYHLFSSQRIFCLSWAVTSSSAAKFWWAPGTLRKFPMAWRICRYFTFCLLELCLRKKEWGPTHSPLKNT